MERFCDVLFIKSPVPNGQMIDYATPIADLMRRNSRETKLKEATDWLGNRWVLHKANHVKKLPEPLPEVFSWKPAKVLKNRK